MPAARLLVHTATVLRTLLMRLVHLVSQVHLARHVTIATVADAVLLERRKVIGQEG